MKKCLPGGTVRTSLVPKKENLSKRSIHLEQSENSGIKTSLIIGQLLTLQFGKSADNWAKYDRQILKFEIRDGGN